MEPITVPVPGRSQPAFLPEPPPLPRTYKYPEVAQILRVSVRTLKDWVGKGCVESPIRFGYSARFSQAQVDAMISGVQLPATHKPTVSPRQKIGQKGGKATSKNKRAALAAVKKSKAISLRTKSHVRSQTAHVKKGRK